jgi:hypothetical protein
MAHGAQGWATALQVALSLGLMTCIIKVTNNNAHTQVVLSSDEAVFGGWRNASKEHDVEYATASDDHDGRPHSFTVYAPSRTVAVYAPAQYCDAKARARRPPSL